jgi:hypothetical protein
VYCDNADCNGYSIQNGPGSSAHQPSTGRIDPPWITTMGWQGFSGQSGFIEFGKQPFAANENGGIRGEVIYASTRPFDDPALLIHTSWTPNVPNVTVNLYQKTVAADGSVALTLVDTTKTSSWDDFAQGFRTNNVPNMNCPGQETQAKDPFFFTLRNSTQWLDPTQKQLPSNAQFKCYDGMHAFNQLQPAPYDGMYSFPSVTGRNPGNGKATGTNCTICVKNPTGDGTMMLPPGKYVVEVILPPGYELVKEEDKNILIGDNYIAPVTQQFGALGNIFILPDQAAVNATYNRFNAQNPTTGLGSSPRHEGDTGSVETFWPCVGALRVVPDYISLFPGSKEVAPFAGASRNLCDRKEVILTDQMTVLAKFWVFSSTHVAAHYTGFMLDDFSSEFDPYSPQFGEKFAVPNVPISIKDFGGTEVARLLGPMGHFQRPELFHLGGQSAQSDWLRADHDGGVHERSGYARPGAPRQDHARPALQPRLQPVLLRDPVYAGSDAVHGHASGACPGVRRWLQPAGLRLSRRHASHLDCARRYGGYWQRAMGAGGRQQPDHQGAWRSDGDQPRLQRPIGHDGAVQREVHQPALRLW